MSIEENVLQPRERAKVYITQIPNRRDDGTGQMKPMFDVLPAAEFGDIQPAMMPASFSLFQTADMVRQLKNGLFDYDFARGDAVVITGDPAIIFACGAILAQQHTKMRLLKWERSVRRYVPVEVAL